MAFMRSDWSLIINSKCNIIRKDREFWQLFIFSVGATFSVALQNGLKITSSEFVGNVPMNGLSFGCSQLEFGEELVQFEVVALFEMIASVDCSLLLLGGDFVTFELLWAKKRMVCLKRFADGFSLIFW
jgi:hypothetical protein